MRRLFSMMAIAVAIVVLPTIAMADGAKDKKGHRGHRRPDAKAMFARFDADKDGQVSISELPEPMQKRLGDRLKKADANSDGKLSKDEFKALMKSRMEAAKAKRDKGKRDKGKKDGRKARRSMGKKDHPAPDFKAMFARFDTNGDKKLCIDEFTAGAKKVHQRIAAHMKKTASRRGGYPHHGEHMRRGGPEMAKKMLAGMEKRFDEADKNKDGKVTLDEVPADMKERFAKLLEKFDADGDKALTKEEGKKIADEIMKKFAKGGHGKPNPEMLKKIRAKMDERFKSADQDGDGKLSKEEAPERLQQHFDKIDADKDGQLTREELKKAFEARRKAIGKDHKRGPKGPKGKRGKGKDAPPKPPKK